MRPPYERQDRQQVQDHEHDVDGDSGFGHEAHRQGKHALRKQLPAFISRAQPIAMSKFAAGPAAATPQHVPLGSAQRVKIHRHRLRPAEQDPGAAEEFAHHQDQERMTIVPTMSM